MVTFTVLVDLHDVRLLLAITSYVEFPGDEGVNIGADPVVVDRFVVVMPDHE